MSTDVQDRPVDAPAPVTAPTPAGGDAEAPSGSGLTFEAIAVISMVIAFAAVITSIFALGLAARSIDEHRAVPAGGTGGGPVAVALDEFTISPAPITVSAGGALAVSNEGTTTHDLTVEGQELTTGTLDAGGTGELDLSSLDAGTYTVFCSIPGHRESGMEDEVTIG